MKIRIDSVFLSSVLFSIALLNLIPAGRWYFSSPTDKVAGLDASLQAQFQTWHYLGVASLAIIPIALIVVWTGYIKRARSAWVVMFVVTWAWAFPFFALPYLKGPSIFTVPEWIYNAIYEPGYPRSKAQLVVTFSLMVIALLLPMKSFFLVRETSAPTQALSLKLIGRFAVIVLLIVIALFVWIHAQVYAIPPEQLNSWQQLPPPPPPPTPRKAQ